jgi:hypothetical protein
MQNIRMNMAQFESFLGSFKKTRQELDRARNNHNEACDAQRAYTSDHPEVSKCPKEIYDAIDRARKNINKAISADNEFYNILLNFLRNFEGHIAKIDLQGLRADIKQLEEIFSAIESNKNLVVSAINISSEYFDVEFLQKWLPVFISEEKFEHRKYVILGFDQPEKASSINLNVHARNNAQQQWLKNKIETLNNEDLILPEEVSTLSLDKKIELTSCLGLFKNKMTLRTYLIDMVGKNIAIASAIYNALTTPEAQPELFSILGSNVKGRKICEELVGKQSQSELEIPLLNVMNLKMTRS